MPYNLTSHHHFSQNICQGHCQADGSQQICQKQVKTEVQLHGLAEVTGEKEDETPFLSGDKVISGTPPPMQVSDDTGTDHTQIQPDNPSPQNRHFFTQCGRSHGAGAPCCPPQAWDQ